MSPMWQSVGAHLILMCILLVVGLKGLGGESEFLFRAQELNLFLPTAQFYEQLTAYPGGTLSWLSAFCTQILYIPQVGILLLVLLWWTTSWMASQAFRLPVRWYGLLLILPAALLAAIVQTGYFIFYVKLVGYIFVPTLGMFFSAASLWIWRLLRNRNGLRLTWTILWAAAGYALFGAWSFAGTLYMALLSLTEGGAKWSTRIVHIVVALLCTALVPCVAAFIYQQTAGEFVYVAGMPCLQVGETVLNEFKYAYYAMFVAWLPLVAVNLPTRWKVPAWACGAVQLCLAALVIWGVSLRWYEDHNFKKELKMARAIEEADWNTVLRIARDGSGGAPTRLIVMNRNLALFRLGRAGDEMFTYPEGGTPPKANFGVRLAQTGGKQLYMHYGKCNFAYRWCMEDCVEFGWNIENLKVMTKTALLNEDWEVAKKYIRILKQTLFHGDWAKKYEAFLYRPDLIKSDEELGPITHLMTYKDQLDGDNTLVELYLLNSFARGHGEDPIYQEQTLISAMLLKDIDLFWPRFFHYATIHEKEKTMPRHYQEAVYLYGQLENKVDISKMPFDPEVKATYKAFMEFNQKCGAMSEEQKAVAFYPQFGNTFFYYYFLVRNIKTN